MCTLLILTGEQESRAEVRGRASDGASAYLLGARRILHLLITQDVRTFKSFKGTSFLNYSWPHASHTLTDLASHHAALADSKRGRDGIGSDVTKTGTTLRKTNLKL